MKVSSTEPSDKVELDQQNTDLLLGVGISVLVL